MDGQPGDQRRSGWICRERPQTFAVFAVAFLVGATMVAVAWHYRSADQPTDPGVTACVWIAAHRAKTSNFASQRPEFAMSAHSDLRNAGLAYLKSSSGSAATQDGYTVMTDWTTLAISCGRYGAPIVSTAR